MRFHNFPANSTQKGELLFFPPLKKKNVSPLFSQSIAVEWYFSLKSTEAVSIILP